jgi:hypothetical protein
MKLDVRVGSMLLIKTAIIGPRPLIVAVADGSQSDLLGASN